MRGSWSVNEDAGIGLLRFAHGPAGPDARAYGREDFEVAMDEVAAVGWEIVPIDDWHQVIDKDSYYLLRRAA